MKFSRSYFFRTLPCIVGRLSVTLTLTIISTVFSLIIGMVFAIISYYKVRDVSQVLKIWIFSTRGALAVAQLFFFYYGLVNSSSLILSISPIVVAVVIMSLNMRAFVSEFIHGVLISVDKGQREAAMASGMTGFQMTIKTVMPQAIRVTPPSLFNDLINLFKMSSLIFLVGVRDVTGAAKIEGANTFRFSECYVYVMLTYWVTALILTAFQKVSEKRCNAIFQTVCLYIIILIKWREHTKDKKATALITSAALAVVSMAGRSDQNLEPAASAKATQANSSEYAKTDNSGNDTEPTESCTVIVGTVGTGESYSMADDQGNWVGAEADLWAEIEACTEWTIKAKQVLGMASLSGELDIGRADMTADYFATTEVRLKTYIASDPIYVDAQAIVVRPGSEHRVLDDLRGHTIGVTARQAAQSAVENTTPDYDREIVTYKDSNAGSQDCSLRRIDCCTNIIINIEKAEKAQNLEFRMLDQELFRSNVGWWFADTEEGAELRDDINMVLREMHEDGTVSEVITRWFYEDLSQLISDEWLMATH